jgi:dTDP-glucose 4,6-dehydratase
MHLLVYGANGWIGRQFTDILDSKNIAYTRGCCRVDQVGDVIIELDRIVPSHVVSFIGRTHGTIDGKAYTTIDYLEEKGKLVENVRDNLFSPLVLAEACKKRSIHFTYLGTGCIFQYDQDQHPWGEEVNGFWEEDNPNFFGSSYSVVKGFTDRMMRILYGDTALNLRIRMPITGQRNVRNFITKIVGYEKICSVPNSMTVLPELLPLALDMMIRGVTGTVNLTNPGLITHNRVLEMYRELVDPLFEWKTFSVDEQRKVLGADRSNNYLDTTVLQCMYPSVSPIENAVRRCLVQYAKEEEEKRSKVRLLVTGGCGFIGSNFVNYYFPRGRVDRLVNVDAMYYCASEEHVAQEIRESSGYVLEKGNLCDMSFVQEVLKKHSITHVIHFAAQSHVQNSFTDSIKFTHDNVMGTHTLLEACRRYGKIQRFIHVSTDEVYGESGLPGTEGACKTELSVLCPTNPYAATKAGAELIAQAYYHSFKMPIIVTRGNNVYGPNQYPEKLIPLFIKRLKEGKPVQIQGQGTAIRAFLHASDTARAFEAVLEKGKTGEIYNIGCDENMEYTVMEVARILIKMIRGPDEDCDAWIEFVEDRPFNDQRYYISNEKVKALGWGIRVDLQTGLEALIRE